MTSKKPEQTLFHQDVSSYGLVVGLSRGEVALRLLARVSLDCMELLSSMQSASSRLLQHSAALKG